MKIFAKILKLSGALTIFIAIVGGIIGMFDYVLVIKGAELPPIDWPMALLMALIGAVLWAIGWLIEKRVGNLDDEPAVRPVLDSTDLSFINSALKRTRKRNLAMGLFVGLFGAGMLAILFVEQQSTGMVIGVILIALLCIAVGGFGLAQYAKLINLEQSEIYKLLMYTPAQVTALDVQVVTSGAGKLGTAINATVKVDNKKKGVLQISEHDLELLKQHLLKHNRSVAITEKIQRA